MIFLGLDLGQVNDSSAITALHQTDKPLEFVPQQPKVLRCILTNNPVGTDAWPEVMGIPKACQCKNCQAWLREKRKGPQVDELKTVENTIYKKPKPGEFTSRLKPHVAGDPAFDLPEDKGFIICPECNGEKTRALKNTEGMVVGSVPCTLCLGKGKVEEFSPALKHYYDCVFLKRWDLGTSYVHIVADIKKLSQHPRITSDKTILIVDGTGVGRPVVDMLRQARLGFPIIPVHIMFGKEIVVKPDGYVHVPKMELVHALEVVLEQRRIGFANSVELAPALLQEFRDFKLRTTKADNLAAGAEGPAHDDLVMSLCVAIWWAERKKKQLKIY